jgi:alginate O-acetyltransferase complex protein AlgI
MLFNSLEFGIFFLVVASVFYAIPSSYRWAWLLISSCYFYMVFIPAYIVILFLIILTNYIAGRAIQTGKEDFKKTILVVTIIINIGVLAFFKYFNFLNENLRDLACFLHWNYSPHFLSLALPLGLSFHTFQALSYVMEVYRKRFEAEEHFGIFATYVMFFPQLVAGPIERPQALLPQFRREAPFNSSQISIGLKLMAWGLFKKVVIADHLSIAVNTVYLNQKNREPLSFVLAAIAFSFQLYCDFSGYSDIARGAAQVMGFKLVRNFNRPYFSKSCTEFWRRWHISLSEWLRDYLFTPLLVRTRYWGDSGFITSMMVTFFIIGLWHGANWTFVFFGMLQGLALITEWYTQRLRKKIASYFPGRSWDFLGAIYTFSFWTMSLVFFRSPSLTEAFRFLKKIQMEGQTIMIDLFNFSLWKDTLVRMGLSKWEWFLVFFSVIILETVHWLQRRYSISQLLSQCSFPVRLALDYALIISIFCLGNFNKSEFIYFQF